MQRIPKIFIIAGEASGDINGAELVNSISVFDNSITFAGIGGTKLKESNVEIIQDYSAINFIGFSNVAKNIFKIKRVLKNTVEYVKKTNPDLVILIDFPGFNLKFAEEIKKFYKGKIVYYISPQIWAWHKKRIEKIRRYIDRMLVIFPFEVEFYEKLNYKVDYVGHPMVKRIDDFIMKNKRLVRDTLNITLLPGSRREEIERIFPVLANAAEKIRNDFKAEINLIYPENIGPLVYKNILKGRPINLIPNNSNNHFKTLYNSDLVLTKFGTTTLELGLLSVPFISVYKAGLFNYAIAKLLSQIKFVSMPNILMGKEIVKEFIQNDFKTEKITEEAKRILSDSNYRNLMNDNFKNMKNIFTEFPVKKTAAEIILEELRKNLK
jgi:lipid-A-disaccharide synthase